MCVKKLNLQLEARRKRWQRPRNMKRRFFPSTSVAPCLHVCGTVFPYPRLWHRVFTSVAPCLHIRSSSPLSVHKQHVPARYNNNKGRNTTGPPRGELRCISSVTDADRRRRQTTTDASDRYLSSPPTLCVGGLVITQLIRQSRGFSAMFCGHFNVSYTGSLSFNFQPS